MLYISLSVEVPKESLQDGKFHQSWPAGSEVFLEDLFQTNVFLFPVFLGKGRSP